VPNRQAALQASAGRGREQDICSGATGIFGFLPMVCTRFV
jgi:hypothetical protein